MAPEIISRKDARAQGLKRFFTGRLCRNGHVAELYVIGGRCVVCLMEWKRGWRAENRAKVNEQARAYRASDPEKARARTKKWQSTPEGKATKARLQRERRSRLRGSLGAHTASDLAEILKSQNYRCAYCRADVRHSYEVDHIVSLAHGGSNGRRNVQIVCASCNRRKRTKDPVRFAQELGMLI